MSCDRHREDSAEIQRHALVLLLVINATMYFLEMAAGVLANSTALLADSLDMLADAAIYGIALYAVGRPHSAKRRAAFTSGIFQGVLGLMVVGEVIRHFLYGSEPVSLVMILGGAARTGSECQLSMASSEATSRRSSYSCFLDFHQNRCAR
jgi:Co/Zn/Cd efflux system component